MDILYYDAWEDFAQEYQESEAVRDRVRHIAPMIKDDAGKESGNADEVNDDDKRDVARVIGCVARIDQTCIGKTAKQIRADVDVQRLSKEQFQRVSSIPFV